MKYKESSKTGYQWGAEGSTGVRLGLVSPCSSSDPSSSSIGSSSMLQRGGY